MEPKKSLFIETLHSNLGHIAKTCKACGISRQTYYNWMELDEEFKKAIESIEEYILDTVEDSLLTQIKKGNVVAAIFYLKTKGKKRGFIEKNETEITGNLKMPIIQYLPPKDAEAAHGTGTAN